MSKSELTPEKRQMIEDLARDLIRELELTDGALLSEVYVDSDDDGDWREISQHFGSNAAHTVEQFLIRQVGKGLL